MFSDQFARGGVEMRIGTEEPHTVFLFARIRSADGTGAFGNQSGCGNVPDVRPGFEITVGTAAGNMADIDGRRAHNAYLVDGAGRIAEKGYGALIKIFGEAGEEGGFFHGCDIRRVYRFAVAERGAVRGGGITFVQHRNKNAPGQYFAVAPNGD